MDVDINDNNTTDDTFTFPVLARLLWTLGLEEHFCEVIEKVLYPLHDKCLSYPDNQDQCIDIVSQWSVSKVVKFINSCSFLNHEIAKCCHKEFVDGICFLNLMENDCDALKLEGKGFSLIRIIRDGWRFSLGERLYHNKNVPPLVAIGLMADLSSLPMALAKSLDSADNEAAKNGVGKIYGQLLVLGYKEYKYVGDDGYLPVGMNNEKFLLARRKIPNGIKPVDKSLNTPSTQLSPFTVEGYCENNRFVLNFITDPTKDVFQIGRSECSSNDFVVRGYCHEDRSSKKYTGPTGRYACRIVCNRLPPYRSFIFAAGFNEKKAISLIDNKHIINRPSKPEFDVLTAFGVKLWHPNLKKWAEVSYNGNIYDIRKNVDEIGLEMNDNEFTNELLDGSIIDLCGISIMFQKSPPSSSTLNPQMIINEINESKPQCPVLLHSIEFQYLNPRQRAIRAIKNLEESMIGYHIPGSLHVPTVDYSDIAEQHRSFVFPSCGHVHGFHTMLIGKACPLCRAVGDFVPLAFDFQASIDAAIPTHVFNPCGHVGSEECCKYWSQVPQPVYEGKTKVDRMTPKCPFCATELVTSNPYNKLILQTESGKEWSDLAAIIELEEENINLEQKPKLSSLEFTNCLKQYPKYAPQLGINGY